MIKEITTEFANKFDSIEDAIRAADAITFALAKHGVYTSIYNEAKIELLKMLK